MLKKALKKLNICQEAYCETMSALIERFRAKGLKEEYERKCGKLRGYLECLSDMDVITTSEMMNLYGYYFSEDRSKNGIKTYTNEQAGRKWVAFEKGSKYYEEYFEYFSGSGWRSYGITEISKEDYEEYDEI